MCLATTYYSSADGTSNVWPANKSEEGETIHRGHGQHPGLSSGSEHDAKVQ